MRRRDRAHAGHPSTYVANWPAVADTLRGSPFAVDDQDSEGGDSNLSHWHSKILVRR